MSDRPGGRGGHPPQQLTGQTFGRLHVLGPSPPPERPQPGSYWLCECACQVQRPVHGASLRSGRVLSCGCLRRERAAEIGRRNAGRVRALARDFGNTPRG